MKALSAVSASLALLVTVASISAAELESGIQVGGQIGAYSGTKCAGIDDGVEVGQSLCYT